MTFLLALIFIAPPSHADEPAPSLSCTRQTILKKAREKMREEEWAAQQRRDAQAVGEYVNPTTATRATRADVARAVTTWVIARSNRTSEMVIASSPFGSTRQLPRSPASPIITSSISMGEVLDRLSNSEARQFRSRLEQGYPVYRLNPIDDANLPASWPGRHSSPTQPAVTHAQFNDFVRRLRNEGIYVEYDTSVGRTTGIFGVHTSRDVSYISIGPSTSFNTFVHEVNHARFRLATLRTFMPSSDPARGVLEHALRHAEPGTLARYEEVLNVLRSPALVATRDKLARAGITVEQYASALSGYGRSSNGDFLDALYKNLTHQARLIRTQNADLERVERRIRAILPEGLEANLAAAGVLQGEDLIGLLRIGLANRRSIDESLATLQQQRLIREELIHRVRDRLVADSGGTLSQAEAMAIIRAPRRADRNSSVREANSAYREYLDKAAYRLNNQIRSIIDLEPAQRTEVQKRTLLRAFQRLAILQERIELLQLGVPAATLAFVMSDSEIDALPVSDALRDYLGVIAQERFEQVERGSGQ